MDEMSRFWEHPLLAQDHGEILVELKTGVQVTYYFFCVISISMYIPKGAKL